MTRIIIFNEKNGTFLGSCMGLGFWSRLDAAKQTKAVTFKDIKDAQDYIDSWDSCEPIKEYQFISVNTGQDKYISKENLAYLSLW